MDHLIRVAVLVSSTLDISSRNSVTVAFERYVAVIARVWAKWHNSSSYKVKAI